MIQMKRVNQKRDRITSHERASDAWVVHDGCVAPSDVHGWREAQLRYWIDAVSAVVVSRFQKGRNRKKHPRLGPSHIRYLARVHRQQLIIEVSPPIPHVV